MEITKQLRGETVELKIEGRVDGYWADHLAAAVDQEIRQGFHSIQLDLSQVAFLSSAGIGTLVRLYKDLKSIQGSFAVSNCSRSVLKVLQLSKLEEILIAKVAGAPSTTDARPVEAPAAPSKFERPEAIYEAYALAPEAKLDCQRIGEPWPLETCGFDKEHCRTLQFSDSTLQSGSERLVTTLKIASAVSACGCIPAKRSLSYSGAEYFRNYSNRPTKAA